MHSTFLRVGGGDIKSEYSGLKKEKKTISGASNLKKINLIRLFFHEGDGIHRQLISSVLLQYQRHDKFTMLLSRRPNNNNNNNIKT